LAYQQRLAAEALAARPDVPTSWIIEDDVPQSMIDLGKEIQEFVDYLKSLWISN
jgi:hypothetical protein